MTPLAPDEYGRIADELAGMDVVRFRYLSEAPGTKPHLGMIAEDAPVDIVDANGRAIRLPETVAYLVAANRALAAQKDALRTDLDALRRDVDALRAGAR